MLENFRHDIFVYKPFWRIRMYIKGESPANKKVVNRRFGGRGRVTSGIRSHDIQNHNLTL